MNTIFDINFKEYDGWYERHKFAYLSEVEALKKAIPKKGKGLEIGVGTGRFAVPLEIKYGIDPSAKMLKIAKKRGVKTYHGIGEKLPFKDKSFDFVLIAITLCFVKNPGSVIAESGRVLKDNGKIILGIVDKNSFLGRFYLKEKKQGHKFYRYANFFSTDEVVKLLKKHNFGKVRIFQTVFQLPENIKKIEKPKKGINPGGFTVIAGERLK
ncbi:MAG TPA: SAM-dependent methyltransferase [Elusimicrobia bacterium]|nr:SAM-dependent methyltransferase [Elusimicrobiota bacterium]